MKKFFERFKGLIDGIFFGLMGVITLIVEAVFSGGDIAIYVVGGMLVVVGIYSLLDYFLATPKDEE